MPLKIYYPFKPYQITQAWGVENPAYSQQFDDPNFKRHNGIDAIASVFDPNKPNQRLTEWPIYCPVEGFVVTEVAWYPTGGGNQLGLRSKEKLMIDGKLCYVSILLCHGKKILVKPGYEPALGELLMIADNTGFSTGPHTHMGMYRLGPKFQKLDTNEATGSYDPAKFFTGEFAIDKATYSTLFLDTMRYYYEYIRG